MNRNTSVKIGDTIFQMELFSDKAPLATKAYSNYGRLDGILIHSMWSGPLCLVNGVNLENAPLENDAAFLIRGDVAYHPVHKEIGICYNTTQWREPIGSVYVTRLGRILDNLDELAKIGGSMQRKGQQTITFG